mgnify:CR=1 FL=1
MPCPLCFFLCQTLRKNKGLSQEELSIKLHVVRQTVSKWESGLSVPDAEMLITISEIFETPVNELLGASIEEKDKNDDAEILEILKAINGIKNLGWQNAVYCYYVLDMSYAEIGFQEYISEETARWRRNKGLEVIEF